jgi:hypothetical protein
MRKRQRDSKATTASALSNKRTRFDKAMIDKPKELEMDTIIVLRLPLAAQAKLALHASGPMATKELVEDVCAALFKHTKDARVAPTTVKQTLGGAAAHRMEQA